MDHIRQSFQAKREVTNSQRKKQYQKQVKCCLQNIIKKHKEILNLKAVQRSVPPGLVGGFKPIGWGGASG